MPAKRQAAAPRSRRGHASQQNRGLLAARVVRRGVVRRPDRGSVHAVDAAAATAQEDSHANAAAAHAGAAPC